MEQDIILETIRTFKDKGIIKPNIIGEALLHHDLFNEVIDEDKTFNTEERDFVLSKINNDDYIVNNYSDFVKELYKNKRSPFLTKYTENEFKNCGVRTFQVQGYEIGFALKPMADGNVDIISVHNNTDIKGIGEALIDSAIRLGGTILDHFDGFLSQFYQNKGFEEYERYKWNDAYAPEDWDYEKYGRPDVIMRRLRKK